MPDGYHSDIAVEAACPGFALAIARIAGECPGPGGSTWPVRHSGCHIDQPCLRPVFRQMIESAGDT
jgi:hypothetical protein